MSHSQYAYFGEDELQDIIAPNNNSSLVTSGVQKGIVMVLKDQDDYPILSAACFCQKVAHPMSITNYQFQQCLNDIMGKYFSLTATPALVNAINESFANEEVFFHAVELNGMKICVSEVCVPTTEINREDYARGLS